MQIIPPWELRLCPTEKYACYSFDKAKELIKLDLELQLKLKECEVCKTVLESANGTIQHQEEVIKKLEDNVETLTKMYNRRKEISEKQATEIAKLERYNIFGNALPLFLGAVIGGITLGFVGGYLLGR